MINLASKSVSRRALFLAFNASTVVFLVLFVFAPILTHFASRSEDISDKAAQVSHFENIIRSAKTSMKKTSQAGDAFLPGSEERVVSADLQAGLKAVATVAGVRLLGIRGLQSNRSQQLHMVAVGVELEGSLSAVRDVILGIENQKPFLFLTAASLRSVADGDGGLIRAELTVQGAMRDSGSSSGAAEVIPQ
jgi:general secretion pathway protein M